MRDAQAAPRAAPATHVGLLGHSPSLTGAQRAELGKILRNLRRDRQGHLTLHHCCRSGSDDIAHRIARNIRGWQIHGHPDTDSTPRPLQRLMEEVDTLHDDRTQVERDADIAMLSHVLIVICLRDGARVTRPVLPERSRPGQKVIYLPQQPQNNHTVGDRPNGRDDRVPDGESVHAIPSGLPSLGKRR